MRMLILAAMLALPASASAQVLAIQNPGSLQPANGSSNVDHTIGQKGVFITFVPAAGGAFTAGDPALPLQLGGATVEVAFGGTNHTCVLDDLTPGAGACGFAAADGPFPNGVQESIEIRLGDVLPPSTTVSIDLANIVPSGPDNTPFDLTDWSFTTRTTPFDRDPLHLALVFDTSGSMNSAAVPGGGSGAPTRIEAMRTGIAPLFDLLAQYGRAGDRVGAVFFDTSASALVPADASAGNMIDVLNASARTAMRNGILNEPAGGSTNLGGGLEVARDQEFLSVTPLPGGTVNRTIVLMSDGEQNRNPMVTTPGGALQVGGSAYPGNMTVEPVTIHTITAGRMTAPGYALQAAIAGAADGNPPLHVTDSADSIPASEFQTYFVQTLADELFGDKVEMVLDQTSRLGSGETEAFSFPATSDEVALSLFLTWQLPEGPASEFRQVPVLIAPDGTRVDVRRFLRFAPGSVSAKVPLPVLDRSGFLDSAGEWQVVLRGELPEIENHLMVLLDNTTIATEYAFDAPEYLTGQPIRIEARLLEGGEPLRDAEVVALVRRPQTGLGNLLSEADLDAGDPDLGEPFDPAQAKLAALLRNRELAEQLRQTREEPIKLLDDGDMASGDAVAGDGIYSALDHDTETEGHYSFDVTVRASNRNGEEVRRVHRLTTHVRPGPEPGASDFAVGDVAQRADGSVRAALDLTLRDRFGNLLGPGYADAIAVDLSRGRVEGTRDLLNGSYQVFVVLPPLPGGGDPLTGPPVAVELAVLGSRALSLVSDELGDGSAPPIEPPADETFERLCRALIGSLRVLTDEAVRRQLPALVEDAAPGASREAMEAMILEVFAREMAEGGELDPMLNRRLERLLEALLEEVRRR